MGRKLSHEEVGNRLSNLGFELMSTYINKKTKSKIKCFCGSIFDATTDHIFTGYIKSCGCARIGINSKDITGQEFNMLKAVKATNKRRSGSVVWEFDCKCGSKYYGPLTAVKFGNTKSCGCLDIKIATDRLKTLHPNQKGKNHPSYLGDTIDRTKRGLLETLDWRKAIYKRDLYTCQKCGSKNCPITAHHLNGWNKFPEQRFDIDNGITLCNVCHIKFHKNFGYGNNTKEQYIEYRGV